MEIPNKILEWVENNRYYDGVEGVVNADGLIRFINDLIDPPKKMVWHIRTKDNQEWRPVTDDAYEAGKELARFEFQQFEV